MPRVPGRDDELADLRDECEQLRGEVEQAGLAAREAEHEAGRLRGTIAEMQVQLVRARQDQERYQRWLDARRGVHERLAGVKRRVARGRGRQDG